MLQGRCLCGAVRYHYRAKPKDLTVCHCAMCRRWHGGLGAYLAGVSQDYELDGTEHLRWYGSSPDAQRGFCALCGSKLFWRLADGSVMDVTAGTLDQPTHLSTRAHIWVAHKGDYYTIEDDVPRYVEASDGAPMQGDPYPPIATDMAERRGRCLCGAIAFRIEGKVRDGVACHCGQCLRWHGHFGVYTASTWANIAPRQWESLVWYQSSDTARRGFCGMCGSSLFWDPSHGKHVSISAGALDRPTGLVTTRHIFTESKGDYYQIPHSVEQASGDMHDNPVTF